MNVDCCHRCGFPLTCSQHGQKASGILRIVCRNHRCLEPPRLATAPVAGEAEMVAAQGPFIVAATCARTGKWHHDECEQFSSVADAAEVARANSIMSELSWYVLDKDREIQLDPGELQDWPGAAQNGGEG